AIAALGHTRPYMGQVPLLAEQPRRTRVHRRHDELLVPAGEQRILALERWYRRAARDEIGSRLNAACAQTSNSYTALTICSQRTRWASCLHIGAMSFNWRLLLVSELVLDYVVWHEVCHFEVFDHSPRFWALLE